MKHQVFFGAAIRLIILFSIGMAGTLIPEYSREFFGDTPCTERCMGMIDSSWNWGSRHYWFHWLCVALFLWSLVNVVWHTINSFKKHHPEIM